MNFLALIVSIPVLLMALDRINAINWFTARAYANVQVLGIAAVGLWGVWGAFTDDVPPLLWLLLLASILWLLWTLQDWKKGAPRHIQTRPADLGPPELERFK